MAQAIDKNVNGFLGESVLLYLTDFQLNKNIVIDYMHGILLGITKTFMSLWFDSKYSTKPYNIGKQVSTIDKKLIQVTPPHVINRLPRKISLSLKNWKASELRAWLLFYSLPCLQGTLHAIYLKHFALLEEATYLLLTEGITDEDTKRANHLLNMFVQTAAGLYIIYNGP